MPWAPHYGGSWLPPGSAQSSLGSPWMHGAGGFTASHPGFCEGSQEDFSFSLLWNQDRICWSQQHPSLEESSGQWHHGIGWCHNITVTGVGQCVMSLSVSCFWFSILRLNLQMITAVWSDGLHVWAPKQSFRVITKRHHFMAHVISSASFHVNYSYCSGSNDVCM